MLAASTRYLRTDEVNELDDLGSSSHGTLQIAAERMSIPFGHPQPTTCDSWDWQLRQKQLDIANVYKFGVTS